MNGLTTIRMLQKLNPQLKIIAASGLVSNEQVELAAGLGVKALLAKPYAVRELLNTINGVLSASGSASVGRELRFPGELGFVLYRD